jgi:hypothetical protein
LAGWQTSSDTPETAENDPAIGFGQNKKQKAYNYEYRRILPEVFTLSLLLIYRTSVETLSYIMLMQMGYFVR